MALEQLGSGSKKKYPRVKAKTTTQQRTQKTTLSERKFTR